MSEVSGVTPSASGLQMQFLKLLVAQLQNQNPLALAVAEGRYATSLIGKEITVTAADGTVASGRVTGVERTNGQFVLQVGDQRVPLDAVREIRE